MDEDSYKAMQLKVPESYFKAVLQVLENMRNETWGDIILKTGDKSLFAHRLVLAAHCGYFKTLFEGNFSDSKIKEIDLSSVIEDADVFDRILKFMYCGDLEYSEEEFWEVARLASYFEIEALIHLCEDKMKRQVTLSNSIEFFMFAHSHGYQKIDDITNEVIEPRFRDYFAFQESTLELRPSDLRWMFQTGFFKNCGNAAFLNFVGKWVERGGTDQYVEVAREIVDYLDEEVNFSVAGYSNALLSLEECFNRLEIKFGEKDKEVENSVSTLFLKKFASLVSELKEIKEVLIDEEEVVLFAIIERKKKQLLLDPDTEEEMSKPDWRSKKKPTDSVFQVLVFRPLSNCWYQYSSATVDRKIFRYLPENEHFPLEQKDCKCFVVGKCLICVAGNSNYVLCLDFEKNEWKKLNVKLPRKDIDIFRISSLFLEYPQLENHNWNDIGKHFSVCGNDLFVVFTKPIVRDSIGEYDSYNIVGCSFQVCKVDIQDGTLTDIACTQIQRFEYRQYLSDLLNSFCLKSSALVQVNQGCSEMLVLALVHNKPEDTVLEQYYLFIVNINDRSIHFFPEETTGQLRYPFKDLHIVEKSDCFLVVRHFDEDLYEIVAEYKFLSREILFREGISKPEREEFFRLDRIWSFYVNPPSKQEIYYGGGQGLWLFSGYWHYTCDFKYLPLKNYRAVERKATKDACNKESLDSEENTVQNESSEDKSMEAEVEKEAIENQNNEGSSVDSSGVAEKCDQDGLGEGNISDTRTDNEIEDGDVNKNKDVDENEEETENSIELIPPPFAYVKCVWEAKMNKAFLENLTPVIEFLS